MNKRGFTLFETILYISIIGIILAIMSSFVLNLMNARMKVQASSEVVHAARLFEDRLSDAVRHAKSINVSSSIFGIDPGILSLQMIDVTKDPTVFRLDVDNGKIEVSEGGGSFQFLTTAKLSTSNLVFTNLTTAKDKGVIQVLFTFSTLNPSNVPFYYFTKSFQSSYRIPLP